MKKFFATAAFVLVFGFYALNQYVSSASASYVATVPTAGANVSSSNPAPVAVASAAPPPVRTPKPAPTPRPTPAPTPTPAPPPKPKGQYADGSYTGTSENAYYGYVQVRATISGGRLADVTFLQYPSDRSTSRMINSQAMPLLTQEAISAQSANVDGVSGATDTSYAFRESLSSALSQAANS